MALNTSVQRQHAEKLPELFKLPTDPHQSVDAFRSILEAPDNLVLLAEDTEPIGYLYAQFQNRPASWVRMELPVFYIHHMVVAPKHRRRGVGTALLSSALEAARGKRIKRVELGVWSFNTEGKRFWAKHGFEVFNEWMQLSIDGL